MRRSKLESYQDILSVLAKKPATVDEIAYQCNMNCVNVSDRLTFLMENGLLELNSEKTKHVFSLSRRGTAIYQTLAIAKNLEKLQDTAKTMRETIQTFQMITDEAKDPIQHRK